jgi:hypothetical protein
MNTNSIPSVKNGSKGLSLQKICLELLSDLPERVKEVVLRRFALSGQKEGETLEEIGKSFGITRERVRQIEESGLEKIRPRIKNYQKIFQKFFDYLGKQGGLKEEEILLGELGEGKYQSQVFFLLSLDTRFKRISESEGFKSFWTIGDNFFDKAKEIINTLLEKLKTLGKPVTLKELNVFAVIGETELNSYLEISKNIQKNSENVFGLRDWPEINPRGIKDKAYLIFKKMGKPLHFTEVTKLIQGSLTQTVHNELIRDARFVLVGRGIYALSEWGYLPGQVKDVITKILKESKNPLTKEEVLSEVLRQRMVKENTILLNLSNRNYFKKDQEGKYTVREI